MTGGGDGVEELAAVDALEHEAERLGRGDHLTQADDALVRQAFEAGLALDDMGDIAPWLAQLASLASGRT